MNTSRKAIVVGGGPAGLVAAARLAEGGVETTLLEASGTLGGRAASERQGG
ncbi:MAG: NAD(P)-binding protein, partial [Solirubrobacterales bacterium]